FGAAVAIRATRRSRRPATPAARSTSPAMSASTGTPRRTTTPTRHRTARTGGMGTAWSSAWPRTRTISRTAGSPCARSRSNAPLREGPCAAARAKVGQLDWWVRERHRERRLRRNRSGMPLAVFRARVHVIEVYATTRPRSIHQAIIARMEGPGHTGRASEYGDAHIPLLVIGAGPYGLSTAANAKTHGIEPH